MRNWFSDIGAMLVGLNFALKHGYTIGESEGPMWSIRNPRRSKAWRTGKIYQLSRCMDAMAERLRRKE